MAIVLRTPLFEIVAPRIGVPKFEFYAILEYYSSRPTIGEKIWGAGGARQHETLGYCVISYYSSRFDAVLLLDIYNGVCHDSWSASDKEVFKRAIRRFKTIRKGKPK